MEETAAEILRRVPSYLTQERYEEAERLLIACLREAEDGTEVHSEARLRLGELYEKEERYREGLIVCRGLADRLPVGTELGDRAWALLGRLHLAEGEIEQARRFTDC